MHPRRWNLIVWSLVISSLLFLSAPALAQNTTTHVVQPGENLYRISLRYGLSVDVIAQANNISNTAQIFYGQTLVIPDMSQSVENALVAAEPSYHDVTPGETLASIANKYGITQEQLAQINNITNPNRILVGQRLTVFTALTNAPASTTSPVTTDAAAVSATVQPTPAPMNIATTHIIAPGENLAQIAQMYRVGWPAVAQLNNITDPNQIYVGQYLMIPEAGTMGDMAAFGVYADPIGAPPAQVGVGREIIVDLSDSRIYAYENGVLMRNVVVSTGLPATPTVQGNFTVQRKYVAQTMTGPGYYLPDVPYVMYFYSGYAIHGTYWHNNFGQQMSHGCVNLPTPESEWFFNFAPEGTPVLVQV
jgi:LysM repeat protein